MPTNWEVMKARLFGEKKPPPAVVAIVAPILSVLKVEHRDNPLQLVSGEVLLLDSENRYVVTNIDTFNRVVDGKDMSFTEYTLKDNLDTGEGVDGKYRYLRMIPKVDLASGRLAHNAVLSEYMWAEDPTDDELRLTMDDFITQFKRADWLAKSAFGDEDTPDYTGYERSGGLTVPYAAVVTERDETGKHSTRTIRYWDFTKWDGVVLSIWFFELSLRDRKLTAMRGALIDEKKIRPLRKVVLH